MKPGDPPARLSGAPPTLVGRGDELDRINRFLTSTAAKGDPRRGGVLVVEGEPGIGKTALSRTVAQQSLRRGATVLSASGVPPEVDIGFAGLTQLLGPVIDRVPQLPPTLRAALFAALGHDELTPGSGPRVAVAVRELLEGMAREGPVVVIVDDLQWVDPATADVLGRATRGLGGVDVRLLVLERTGVRTFFDTSGLPRLTVCPLPDADAAALIATTFPHLDDTSRARVLSESGGNPLALLELPSALPPRRTPAQEPPLTHLPLTQRLQRLFGERLLELDPRVRHLLLMAALGDTNAPLPRREWSELARGLAPAEHAGLVRLDRDLWRVRFRHPLVRSAVIELSTAPERRHAHQALAWGYAEQDDRAAWHLAAATVTPDEEVARLLEAAAYRALRRGDTAGSIRTLVRAADLSPSRPGRARRLAEAAYRGADVGGDLHAASRLLTDADRADPGSGRTLHAAVAAAHLLLNGAGDTHTAHRVLWSALEEAGRTGGADPETLAEAVHTLCEICLYAAHPALWPAFHAAVRGMALEQFPVLALWDRLIVDPARTAHDEIADLDRMLAELAWEPDPVRVERVATAAVFLDRVDTASEPLMRLVRDARGGASLGSGVLALILLAMEDYRRGRWASARELTREGIELTTRNGLDLLGWPLRLTQALLAASSGEHDTVRDLVDQMRGWASPRRVGTVLHYAFYAAGLDALGRGDYEAAYRELSGISPPGVLASHVGHALWVSMDLVEAAVHAGHRDAAEAHVAAMREARLGVLSDRLALLEAGAAAMVAQPLDRGLFETALAMPHADHWPFDLARIRLAYGRRLRRERSASDARGHLQAAAQTFGELGARCWADTAAQELHATSPHKRTKDDSHPGSTLTAQERQVAALAAQGLTNKQIADPLLISPRTVAAHLQSVYRKLGVVSRAGLHLALEEQAMRDAAPSLGEARR